MPDDNVFRPKKDPNSTKGDILNKMGRRGRPTHTVERVYIPRNSPLDVLIRGALDALAGVGLRPFGSPFKGAVSFDTFVKNDDGETYKVSVSIEKVIED